MSLWTRLFGISPVPVSEPSHAVRSAIGDTGVLITTAAELDAYLKEGQETGSGAHVTLESTLRVGAAWRCNAIIAGAVGTLPLGLHRRVDERTRTDASDHPVYSVLRRRPNRWQRPAEFRRMLQTHVNLRGNGYALKVSSRGRLLELVPMHPDRVKVEQKDDLSIEYQYTRRNGGTIKLSQGEVFHLRGLSLDGVRGVSILTYAREAIGLALTTEKHGAKLFRNGINPSVILEHPGVLGEEGRANLRASIDEFRSGGELDGKAFLAEEGMKVSDALTMTSEDAQFLETRKFQRSDVAMFFGVPPHMIGDTEKSTSWGSGIEQQSIGFVTYTLEDWLTMWEEAINVDLIPENEPDVYAKFNRSALLKGDTKARWGAYVQALQWGVFSPNEVRALEDQNPREGGDIYYPPPNTAGDDEPEPDERPEETRDEPAEAA